MTQEHLYKKADKADDMADLDLKDAEPMQIVGACYAEWLNENTDKYKVWMHSDPPREILYRNACRIIRPFKEKLAGELYTDRLPLVKKISEEAEKNSCKDYDTGYFFSAVLNETGVNKLCIGRLSRNEGGFGYRLQPGKTVEVLRWGRVSHIGDRAEGGTVVNNGDVGGMGDYAKSGKFVNNGRADSMGFFAESGDFINHNHAGSMGNYASGNFINHGKVRNIGGESKAGIFINCGSIEEEFGKDGGRFMENGMSYFFNFGTAERMGLKGKGVFVNSGIVKKTFVYGAAESFAADRKVLKENTELNALMGKIRLAAESDNISKIEKLARKVDGHLRGKKYKPRKIA